MHSSVQTKVTKPHAFFKAAVEIQWHLSTQSYKCVESLSPKGNC